MTITEATTHPAGLVPVTFDLYRDIHKGIRAELFGVTLQTGQTDPGDAMAKADLATRLARTVDLLDLHAEHEDAAIRPQLEQVLPSASEQIDEDHEDFEQLGAVLVARAVELTDAAPADQRHLAHCLYLDLAGFVSRYLAHQDLEERIVMPALEAAVGLDAILGMHGQIIGSIPPDEMARSLAIMLPVMNADDRTEMLGGMQANAPAEVFGGMWSLAQSVLSGPDVEQLAGRLGLS